MAYLTSTELQRYATAPERMAKAANSRTSDRTRATTKVFLSHSHKDRDLVVGTINLLAGQGVLVYVDWMDDGMPEVTCPETAARIKVAIGANDRFVLLATDQSLASRWVPWELGCADGVKTSRRMAILPITRPPHAFVGNEYLGIYPRMIVADDGRIAVFPAGQTAGVTLDSWLRD